MPGFSFSNKNKMNEDETLKNDVEIYQETSNEFSRSGTPSHIEEEKTGSQNIFKKLYKIIEIDGTKGLSFTQLLLINYDLRPVEEARRTWAWTNYVFFWIAEAFNINTWEIAATGVKAGLSWWATWITVWIGYFFCGCFLTVAARVGNAYHISFPVSCRSSFGIWGSFWPILNRVVMACVWFGVQSTIGGNCVELMLRAIFGNDLNTRIPNHVSGDTTSFKLLSFFLYWLFQLPFIYMPPHLVRHLFTVKAIVCPCAGVAFLIWTLVKADGGGPVIHEPSTVSGSAFAWAFINSVMNALANFSTLIVNAPDFSRFANKPGAAIWSQFITLPICFSITCLIGVLVSSASTFLYKDTFWNPLDILSKFLDSGSKGDRGGVFILATCFTIAQIGTNISANSLSAGTDMTALLPKFINIRRGGFICAAVGFAICPWNLMSSSSRFTTYLSAYAVFLSSIAGVMFCDYFIIKKGYLEVKNLYVANKTSPYYYSYGVNWRAYFAYICGILPNIVGFVGATETHKVPIGATYVYYFSYFTGYAAAASVLLIITLIFPVEGVPEGIKLLEFKFVEEWEDVEHFELNFKDPKIREELVSVSSQQFSKVEEGFAVTPDKA